MKGIKVDCKTGKVEEVDDGQRFIEQPTPPMPKGIDFEKLKKILKKKGIIADESEIE